MKKKNLILIFLQIILLLYLFTREVKAASCSCSGTADEYGQIISCSGWYGSCGPGWNCSCGGPENGSCPEGVCVQKAPQGKCPNQGDLSYGVSAESEAAATSACQAKGNSCSLSGSVDSYVDEYGYQHILGYECCCQ